MDQAQDGGSSNATNTQRVTRRSVRSSSDVRHGRVYDSNESTAGTGEIPAGTRPSSRPADHYPPDSLHLSPPVESRQYSTHGSRSTPDQDGHASVSNTDEESAPEGRLRKGLKKPKIRRGPSREDLSNSFMAKARRHLSTYPTIPQETDSSTPSIHHLVSNPTSFPVLSNVRDQLPRMPSRTVSSDTASTINSPKISSQLNPDSNKILQLMITTCGRMHGILFFRRVGTSAWESGYCAINVAPGSLICQRQGELASTQTLLADLRGCSVRTRYDSETQSTFISVLLPSSGHGYQLRPPVPETFDSWLAALLCWQPLRPKGINNKMVKSQSLLISDRRAPESRRISDTTSARGTSTVKVGRMLLWDGSLPPGSQRHLSRRTADFDIFDQRQSWRRVSGTLHENGTFKLLTEGDAQTISVLELSSLSRCAVQRLDASVLDAPYCLAVHLQYTSIPTGSQNPKPIIIGLESKSTFEAWFVLLRALTIPELYGPERPLHRTSIDAAGSRAGEVRKDMYRIERTLAIKLTEVKLHRESNVSPVQASSMPWSSSAQPSPSLTKIYAEVGLGRDVRARTVTKPYSALTFWAAEFTVSDLPPVLSTISVAIKLGNPAEQEWTMITPDSYDATTVDAGSLATFNGIEIVSNDPDVGKVEISVVDLEAARSVEKWWPLQDKHGQTVGQLLLKLSLSETIVLMRSEYYKIITLLSTFDNSLTTQISQVLTQDLKQLSEVLLDVFQASELAHNWICTLIEEEIDGIYKDHPPGHVRLSGRLPSNDSYESAEQRELLVRDLTKSANQEANLLFRGNSLVTKALDTHMKRVGREYLETTLGPTIRKILARNAPCEVDPMRLKNPGKLEANWATLMNLTTSVWEAVAASAQSCPPTMRIMFKHIRSCAEDRYGSFNRSVRYTSVSGFLFLRFFCPAILNPTLFGLIEDLPSETGRRTLTLIAKSLNSLASMVKFGNKETWMEPMNKFLLAATPGFKQFIEDVCSISSKARLDVLEAQHLAPVQIRSRLSATSQEGLPSLPFLLDAPKSVATLVDLWLSRVPEQFQAVGPNDALSTFHDACLGIRQRTKDCVSRAEPAEKPSTTQEAQWQQILSEQQESRKQSKYSTKESFPAYHHADGITALPQRSETSGDRSRTRPSRAVDEEGLTSGGPRSQPVQDTRRIPYGGVRGGETSTLVSSTNSSTISFENPEIPGRPSSNHDPTPPKQRLFEYLNPARKKSRSGFAALERPLHFHDDHGAREHGNL